MRNLLIAVGLLFVAVVILSGGHGYLGYAFLSLLLLLLLLFSALPVSNLLWRKSEYTFLFLLPTGYIFHSIILSFVGYFFGLSNTVIIVYLILAIPIGLYSLWRFSDSQFEWTVSDTRWLTLWIFSALAVAALPLWNLGINTDQGFAYRAYFNADFFKHMGLTSTLARDRKSVV